MKRLIARIGLTIIAASMVIGIVLVALHLERQKRGEGLQFIALTCGPLLLSLPLAWCVLNAWD